VRLAWPGATPSPSALASPAAGRPDSAAASPDPSAAGEQPPQAPSGSPSPSHGAASRSPGPRPTTSGATSPAPPPVTALGDEFSGTTLDGTKWDVYGTSGGTAYTPSSVRVTGGELQILGIGRSPVAADNKSGGLCWCKSSGSHIYGRWQVRARFDAGSGYRQALTLWPDTNNATQEGYITFLSDSDAAKTAANMSLVAPNGGRGAEAGMTGDFTAWHVYTVDWRASSVRVYLDGRTVYDSTADPNRPDLPRTSMHLAIQQDKGPGNGIPAANSSTPAQVIMHIDWVHYTP
jgi:beta-glucanase (GH16 family)